MNKQFEKNRAYDRNPRLIELFRSGDTEAGDELVRLNTPLVCGIAARFSGRGADMSDLLECGNMGLVKAINTFDVERGCAFSTYAVPLIFGEIRRFLRDDGAIKVSREEKRLSAQLLRERERRHSLGLPSDVATLAESIGISAEDAASAIYAQMPMRSLDEQVFDDDSETTLGSTITDGEEPERVFDRLALRYAIDGLDSLGKRLIILRYFRDLSQSDTARILGLSQVKVSREEKKILSRLRTELGS